MADAKAKTINLLLYEGDLEGVISIEDSSWNSGELYSAPRDSVSERMKCLNVRMHFSWKDRKPVRRRFPMETLPCLIS